MADRFGRGGTGGIDFVDESTGEVDEVESAEKSCIVEVDGVESDENSCVVEPGDVESDESCIVEPGDVGILWTESGALLRGFSAIGILSFLNFLRGAAGVVCKRFCGKCM